jgi:hypothetical protein
MAALNPPAGGIGANSIKMERAEMLPVGVAR